ncbi:SAM-dependent methyltransferase [Ilumatobacter sp.]|uniref:SAM-dependent methyltransferase n=1 Tax=Ilumatobacter sp. TaxID=1967498 RepID=UPI003C3CE407
MTESERPATSSVTLTPIGRVECPRVEAIDDDWGAIDSVIHLDGEQFTEEVLAGLGDFSHIDVVYFFDRVDESKITLGSRHPRNRPDWPLVGIFAQRAKARPNRLGVTTCELLAVSGLHVTVRGLDAIDGTPVLDIKPHVREFQPRTPVEQPDWIGELMAGYW